MVKTGGPEVWGLVFDTSLVMVGERKTGDSFIPFPPRPMQRSRRFVLR